MSQTTAALRDSSSKFARASIAPAIPKPMKHQVVSLAHDAKTHIVFDVSDAGTGKTAVRIMAYARRRAKKGYGCALVLAPKSLLVSAWANDFAKFAPHLKVVVATAENREKAFAQDADVYITNHDAVKWLDKQKAAFFEKFSELIIDEPTAYKHHTSQRSRAVARIATKHFHKKPEYHGAGLTMTPNSNGICDIWHQVYILDGGKRLGPSFYGFRNSVCTPKQVGRQANMINWVDKPGAEEAVFGELADITIRHKLDDCEDIPQTHYYEVPYQLKASQRKAYDQLEMAQILALIPDAVAERLTGGRVKASTTTNITAVNAAAVASKLLQLSSGAVYDERGNYHVIDTGRYELILDLVEARLSRRPIVFFQWRHQKEQLIAEAEARKLRFAVIDGETKDDARAMIVKRYQHGDLDLILGHPQTMAHGFTLTAGTSTIWAGPTYNLEWFEQGSKRQRRIGQKEKTEVLTVLAEGTIEEKVYDMLRGKDARMKNLLDLFYTVKAERR